MANLSAYIDYSVKLDFKTNTIRIDAVSLAPLPGGVAAITASAIVKQPDSVSAPMSVAVASISPLSFTGNRSMRLTVDKRPQKGIYKVTLTITSVGYENTIIEKTFSVGYVRPAVVIGKNFNLLTPQLQLIDNSIYNAYGYAEPTRTREWSVIISELTELTLTGQTADLAYNGNYYDAEYDVTLKTQLEYTTTEYPFLKIIDEVEGRFFDTADTIPPYSDFPGMLVEIGEKSGADMTVDCCTSDCQSPDYKSAYVLFQDIASHICQSVTPTLLSNISKFLKIYRKWTGEYENTEAIIQPYDLSFCATGIGENNFIRNTTIEQPGSNINISGTLRVGTIPHGEASEDLKYLVALNGAFQYLTAAELLVAINGGSVGAHTHPISQIVNLETTLNGKVDKNANITGATKTKITYDGKGLVTNGADLTEDDIPVISQSKVTGLVAALGGKAALGHIHAISDVTNLQSTLNLKANDADVVHKTGNENIDGVKVFVKQPLVPTPTNDAHAANKAYVDAMIGSGGGGGSSQNGPIKLVVSVPTTYEIPAGFKLREIIITPTVTSTLIVGTTTGGEEIMVSEDIPANTDKPIFYVLVCRIAKTIYFGGITNTTEILIYLDTLTPTT